jgi:hypothetical protein
VSRRWRLGRGNVFALYAMGYTAGRFWIEALRSDPAHHFLGLRLNDWTSLVVFAAALVWFLRHRNTFDESPYVLAPATAEGAAAGDGEEAGDDADASEDSASEDSASAESSAAVEDADGEPGADGEPSADGEPADEPGADAEPATDTARAESAGSAESAESDQSAESAESAQSADRRVGAKAVEAESDSQV